MAVITFWYLWSKLYLSFENVFLKVYSFSLSRWKTCLFSFAIGTILTNALFEFSLSYNSMLKLIYFLLILLAVCYSSMKNEQIIVKLSDVSTLPVLTPNSVSPSVLGTSFFRGEEQTMKYICKLCSEMLASVISYQCSERCALLASGSLTCVSFRNFTCFSFFKVYNKGFKCIFERMGHLLFTCVSCNCLNILYLNLNKEVMKLFSWMYSVSAVRGGWSGGGYGRSCRALL